jgi:hypothetical protein
MAPSSAQQGGSCRGRMILDKSVNLYHDQDVVLAIRLIDLNDRIWWLFQRLPSSLAGWCFSPPCSRVIAVKVYAGCSQPHHIVCSVPYITCPPSQQQLDPLLRCCCQTIGRNNPGGVACMPRDMYQLSNAVGRCRCGVAVLTSSFTADHVARVDSRQLVWSSYMRQAQVIRGARQEQPVHCHRTTCSSMQQGNGRQGRVTTRSIQCACGFLMSMCRKRQDYRSHYHGR